jgi:hypothetical protein
MRKSVISSIHTHPVCLFWSPAAPPAGQFDCVAEGFQSHETFWKPETTSFIRTIGTIDGCRMADRALALKFDLVLLVCYILFVNTDRAAQRTHPHSLSVGAYVASAALFTSVSTYAMRTKPYTALFALPFLLSV